MKKIELHMDALIAIAVVFVLFGVFLLYQRYQYNDLLQENVDLQWENSSLEANLVLLTAQIDKCKSSMETLKAAGAGREQGNSL